MIWKDLMQTTNETDQTAKAIEFKQRMIEKGKKCQIILHCDGKKIAKVEVKYTI